MDTLSDIKATDDATAGSATLTTRLNPGGMRIRWNAEHAARSRASGRWYDRTLADFALERARANPDHVCLIEDGREYTAAALVKEAKRLCNGLIASGLTPGSVISYQLPNWYETSVINIAAALAGLVVNPLVPIYRDGELAFMLPDVQSRMILIPSTYRNHDYVAMLQRVVSTLESPPEVIVLREDKGPFRSYGDLLRAGDTEQPHPEVDPDSIFIMMHTSGTTGRPKCVLHSHNTFCAQRAIFAEAWRFTEQDTYLVATPISHIAGVILATLLPATFGIRVVLMGRWQPAEGLALAIRHGVTAFGGATPFVHGLLEAAMAADEHLPSLRQIGCGGASVPARLIERAQEWFFNAAVNRSYGCTEVPTAATGRPGRSHLARGARTDGHINLTEFKLAQIDTGGPVAPGSEGEILLRGAQMMLGYLRPEDNVEAFDDEGYFRTGDLGQVVDQEFILITGRKKDLIIRAGENLSAKEIEDAMLQHPEISAAAVVSMPHPQTGECVCAFIVTEGGAQIGIAAIGQFLLEQGLARQKAPEHVEIVAELPVSVQGKVLKTVLRDRAKEIASRQGQAE